jgi:hypothetical protein
LQDFWRNVKKRPVFMLAVPVLTFLVLCSLSVAGVVLGANKYESDERNAADAAALDWVSPKHLCTSSSSSSTRVQSQLHSSGRHDRRAQSSVLARHGCAAL